jgi:uncharacterized repeat protein (TIGR03837 family)
LLWDIFCKVVDNFGDIGICWRLSNQLIERGHQVRLWVDDASALHWMAPHTRSNLQILDWPTHDCPDLSRADIWLETFGCGLTDAFINRFSSGGSLHPVWFNVEYLSAQAYVERSHLLPSPVLQGAGAGRTRHLFYPGFTTGTGGLLREDNLLKRQAAFNRGTWLAQWGIQPDAQTRVISLFCYEPLALTGLLKALQQPVQKPFGPQGIKTHLLVTQGRAQAEVARLLRTFNPLGLGALALHNLPALTQTDFDHLLWSCDLNFVRGEDSWVRALWAAKPMVWQAYPQDDDIHHQKLNAFLDWLQAPAPVRQIHHLWNGSISSDPWHLLDLSHTDHLQWQHLMHQARQRLLQDADLVTRLEAAAHRYLVTNDDKIKRPKI